MPFPAGLGAADPPARLLYDRAANYGSIIVWKYLKLHYSIFKGSRDEKLVVLYCKQLGINYKNLSDEEFRWLIRILKKSKKMGTPISQRKKR